MYGVMKNQVKPYNNNKEKFLTMSSVKKMVKI